MKKIRLIVTFYYNFLLVSSVITYCCFDIFRRYGVVTFSSLFWFKIFTLGIIYYFISSYKHKELYYYQNLGLSKKVLFIVTFSFDFILFLTILYLLYRSQ